MLRITRIPNGNFSDNRSLHTADIFCDTCGYAQPEVNMNSVAVYVNGAINLKCADIGGSCNSNTSWPLVGGTADAVELALVKSA